MTSTTVTTTTTTRSASNPTASQQQQQQQPQSNHDETTTTSSRILCPGNLSSSKQSSSNNVQELLISNVSLSFWGGIDPLTGIIVDTSHPLYGRQVKDTILCLPSGRGSCTASQVLLELILNDLAPRAIVLRDVDGLVTVGALIAEQVFDKSNLVILSVGDEGFEQLLRLSTTTEEASLCGSLLPNGTVVAGSSVDSVQRIIQETIASQEEDQLVSFNSDDNSDDLEKLQETLEAHCQTDAEHMAKNVLLGYAQVVGAKAFVDISSSHIDGCTYIGPGGLQFVQRLVQAGGRVQVPTTLNSVSTDRQQWQALGVPQEYAHNAIALGDAYLQLGCQPSFTCAPYLLLPSSSSSTTTPSLLGQDICWGESNAVVFANSVLGARTEKYADYLDICCAILGMAPQTGVHLPEQRVPRIVLDASLLVQELENNNSNDNNTKDEMHLDGFFPVLGHLCGSLSDGKVPLLTGLQSWTSRITQDDLKAFCAAFGTTGTSPLIHIAGITPEALDDTIVSEWTMQIDDNVTLITLDQIQETFDLLDKDRETNPPVELIALGNPHLSISECKKLSQMLQDNSTKHDSVRIMACMSRELYQKAPRPTMQRLEQFGVEFIHDTCWCMLLDPPVIPSSKKTATLTNSGKYAHYGPGLTNRPFRFASTADCLAAAQTGTLPLRGPKWMTKRSYSTSLSRGNFAARACLNVLRRWR